MSVLLFGIPKQKNTHDVYVLYFCLISSHHVDCYLMYVFIWLQRLVVEGTCNLTSEVNVESSGSPARRLSDRLPDEASIEHAAVSFELFYEAPDHVDVWL